MTNDQGLSVPDGASEPVDQQAADQPIDSPVEASSNVEDRPREVVVSHASGNDDSDATDQRSDRISGDDEGPRNRGSRDGGRRGGFRPRGCEFCIGKINVLDYKDVGRLRRYLGERGKMEPRRKVGTCAKHQRMVTRAIKRARHIALLPYTAEHIRQTGTRVGSRR